MVAERIIGSCEVMGVLTEISKVEELIDDVCQKNEIPEDIYGNVLIAVTEGVSNAIIHGSTSEDLVKVDAILKEDSLVFKVSDCGEGFDYDNLPDPTAPENIEMENGRGVFLMRSLADAVSFENNGSTVTLSFKLK